MSSESEVSPCTDPTVEIAEAQDMSVTDQKLSNAESSSLPTIVLPTVIEPSKEKKKKYVYDMGASYGARGSARIAEMDEAHTRKDIPDVPSPPLNTPQHHISKDIDWEPDPLRTALPLIEGLNERFCEKCRRVLEGTQESVQPTFRDASEGSFMEHHDFLQMMDAAAQGCPMCNIVWPAHSLALESRLKTLKKGETQGSPVPMRYDFGRFLYGGDVHVVRFHPYAFHPPSEKNNNILKIIEFDRVNVSMHAIGEDVTEFGVDLNREVSANATGTWSRDTLLQMADWLDDCVANHPACAIRKMDYHDGNTSDNDRNNRFLPARLLKVIGDQPEHVYLVEGDDIAADAAYLTLSHCWGNRSINDHAILTTANRPDFLAGLHESSLPRNFFHACSVTRRLGMHYIWIDSLCIVQDSPEDWLEQSKLMWEIYTNSTLNLSATAATNSDEGLFFFNRRSLAVLDPGVVVIPNHHPQIKSGSNRYIIYNAEEWTDQVDTAPVNTRAWVLQERLLSRRIVHFTEHQVFWECREKRASERFPLSLPPRYEVQEDRALLRKALDSCNDRLLFLEAWDAIVRKYTSCGLTKKTDKLIALSALARQMAIKKDLAGEKYLAGLWSQDLYRQLCWRAAAGGRGEYIRTEQCDAPSWSWASIEGRVFPNFDWFGYGPYGERFKSRSMIRVLEAMVESPGGDAYVGVRGGRLRVRAPLFRIDTSFRKIMAEIEEKHEQEREEQRSPRVEKTREESIRNLVEMMQHKDPGYTGENLQRSIIQDVHGYDPPLKMAIDVSAGIISTDESSGPQRRTAIPTALTQKTAMHKFGIGDDLGEAEMILDRATSILDMSGSEMYFLPVITKSQNNQRFQREGVELNCMEGLVLVPADGDEKDAKKVAGAFQRRGVATLNEYQVTEFLCELGNQEEEEAIETGDGGLGGENLFLKSSERLSIDDFMPERWSGKKLDFVPRNLALYDLTIV